MKDCKQRLIGLITDFGFRGLHYVANMKAIILEINPNVQIIDINHNVTPFNIYEVSFLIRTYKYFPEGTVFIIVVDPGVGSSREILAIKLISNYYFIGPNNGIFSNTFKKIEIEECVKLENDYYFNKPVSNTFHGRDIMAPIGAYITKNVELKEFGPRFDLNGILDYPFTYQISLKNKSIKGIILYIDRFGNGISNIPIKNNTVEGSSLVINEGDLIQLLYKKKKFSGNFTSHFNSVPLKSLLFLKGSYELLEISINQGNAAEEIGFKVGDNILLKIKGLG